MIDLESPIADYGKSFTDLAEEVNGLSIFKRYIPDLEVHTSIHSPLREDNIPSFSVFFAKRHNKWFYKDLATGESGDAIMFKCKYLNISYKEAVITEFVGNNAFKKSVSRDYVKKALEKSQSQIDIKIKVRPYQKHDAEYFKSYGISRKTLEKYNVYAISHVFFNDRPVKVEKYAYAYVEKKDGKLTYKVYQPFIKNKKYKFFNNHDYSVWQGWRQLPKSGNELIITSSLKDVMSIVNVLQVPSIALQAESVMPKKSVVKELKNRFKTIYILYDTDKTGIQYSSKLSEEFNFVQKTIDAKYESKDPSDLIKNLGVYQAKSILEKLIWIK